MTDPPPEVWRMRAPLDTAVLVQPNWPAGITLRTFTADDAPALHALLVHGYARGGGTVAAYDEWHEQTTTDPEFDPELCFLAKSPDAALVGAAQCWTSGFVKDLVVHDSWRRCGLGEALLRQAFTTFAERGAPAVELKVQSTNPAAIRLYERVGMTVVERLPLTS